MRRTDPYQWFFPLGIAAGLLGVGVWVAFQHGLLPYPGLVHADLMVGGFFLIIATGFLMTAIPRFTNTGPATIGEQRLLWGIAALAVIMSLHTSRLPFHALVTGEMLLLLRFGLSRVRQATFRPAPSFPLVGAGLCFGVFGSTLLLIHDLTPLPLPWLLFGRLLFLYGLLYGPMLGIGSQLLPLFMGTCQQTPTPLSPTPMNAATRAQHAQRLFLLVGLLLLVSFIVEIWVSQWLGRLLRAALVTAVVWFAWSIARRPTQPGIFAWCLWISAWMFVLGGWPGVFVPAYHVHGAHILFIGSVSLMIYTVCTRVVLAHGGHDRAPELDSTALYAMLLWLMIALPLRLSFPWLGHEMSHIGATAICWIIATLVWSVTFMPKLIWRNRETVHH